MFLFWPNLVYQKIQVPTTTYSYLGVGILLADLRCNHMVTVATNSLRMANTLATRTILLILVAQWKGLRWILEQPDGSFFPQLPRFQWLLKILKVRGHITIAGFCKYIYTYVGHIFLNLYNVFESMYIYTQLHTCICIKININVSKWGVGNLDHFDGQIVRKVENAFGSLMHTSNKQVQPWSCRIGGVDSCLIRFCYMVVSILLLDWKKVSRLVGHVSPLKGMDVLFLHGSFWWCYLEAPPFMEQWCWSLDFNSW